MDDAVAEQFLLDEQAVPVAGLDPFDRARFGRLVRMCAANWLLHPRGTLRVSRGRHGMALLFEGPMGGKNLTVFTLRAHHATGEYRFIGPNADRKRLGLTAASLEVLDRLRDLYEALLAGHEGAGETVTCVLNGSRVPDLVPLVEETRRALDGGQESGVLPPEAPVSRPRPQKASPDPTQGAQTPALEPATPSSIPEIRVITLRLACPEPAPVVDFWGRVLKLKPSVTGDDGSATFSLLTGELRVTPDLDPKTRKTWGVGTTKVRCGGLVPTLGVPDFDLCLRRARRMGDAIVEEDRKAKRFLVKDPAGFVVEICPAS